MKTEFPDQPALLPPPQYTGPDQPVYGPGPAIPPPYPPGYQPYRTPVYPIAPRRTNPLDVLLTIMITGLILIILASMAIAGLVAANVIQWNSGPVITES